MVGTVRSATHRGGRPTLQVRRFTEVLASMPPVATVGRNRLPGCSCTSGMANVEPTAAAVDVTTAVDALTDF